MSIESNHSSDVTLAMRENTHQPICKFNATGFCKFADSCRKVHVKTICKNTKSKCIIQGCKLFAFTGKCRFVKHCAFDHMKSDTHLKVEELEVKVNILQSEVQLLKSNLLSSENDLLRKALRA